MAPGPTKRFEPDDVLSRAAEAFRARGYRGTSIAQLVDCMGIGRQSLYSTFGGKRALFLRAIAHYGDAAVNDVRATLDQPGSPLENLRRQLRRWQRKHERRGSQGCMLGVSCADFDLTDADVASALRVHLGHIEDALCETIVRCQRMGELPSELDARAVARLIVCTTQGMALVGRVASDGGVARGATTSLINFINRTASFTNCPS